MLLLGQCKRGVFAADKTMISTLCSSTVPTICVSSVSKRSGGNATLHLFPRTDQRESSNAISGCQDLVVQRDRSIVPHFTKLGRTFATVSKHGAKNGTGVMENARKLSSTQTDLHVVLVSPQIPGNTGCIARTCAAAAVGLHLVEPLGFEISSAKLKRAGLDYWPYVVVKVHKSWIEFFEYFQQQEGEKRLLGFTKKGNMPHTALRYRQGDWLLFGSETDGLPEAAIQECLGNKHGGGLVRIPIDETYVRCLNLSVAAGIGIYEALRQLGYSERMTDTVVKDSTSGEREDIFC